MNTVCFLSSSALGLENRIVNDETITQSDKYSGRYLSNVIWEMKKRDN